MKQMIDFHIEFGHIYKDSPFSQEQIDSIQILKKITKQLEEEGLTYQTSVLIDDYHIKTPLWENNQLIEEMKQHGVIADLLVSEASLSHLAEKMIDLIPLKHKRSESFRKDGKVVTFYINGDKKFALKDTYEDRVEIKCVALSCVWMLIKLGLIQDYFDDNIALLERNICCSAGVIVVLDKKYMAVETNVLELLETFGYKEHKKSIRYIFH